MARSRYPRYATSSRPLAEQPLDAIVVPVLSGGEVPSAALAALGPETDLERIAARLRPGASGWSAWVSTGAGEPDLLLVCAGPAADGEAGQDGLRTAAMV